jgi:hypothetical protein
LNIPVTLFLEQTTGMNMKIILFLSAAAACCALSIGAGPAGMGQTPASTEQIPYDTSLYPHWMDEDGDCQDTRDEVLIAESVIPVVYDADLCAVVSGLWYDPYNGDMIRDAASMDVAHFIPLAEVHRSGGHAWTPQKRRQYANDLSDSSTLIAVSAASNRSAGDSGPDKWMPINREFRCLYVTTWVQIKRRWELQISEAEMAAVSATLAGCEMGRR